MLTSATIAIQKSNRCTRASRRSAATSIIPMTTASMMIAASTAVGSPENSGASSTSVSSTIAPDVSDATGERAPVRSFRELADRLVETGMPCSRPAPTLAAPCANDSWSMSTRYRCRAANVRASPAVCENPIITSATDASATVATLSSSRATSGTSTDGSPRGTSPTSATPRSPRSSSQVASSPPTTRTSAPGTRGATRRSPNTVTSATTPTTTVARFTSPSVPSQDHSSCGGVDPSALVPVILGSSPTTTSIAAPNRNPVTTARDRNCAIQPIFSTARTRNTTPDTSVIPATNGAACAPVRPTARTALAATAASPELGPVEICRLVPKIA